jgi:hypothetical protein
MTNTLFTPEALATLSVAGVSQRWNAVQEALHPILLRLAETIQAEGARRYPRQWPFYELSFKSQRYVNRGRERAPIDEYHMAFDRVPRGAGILVSVSGAERAILVGIQLWGTRKNELRQLWEAARPVWQALIERVEQSGEARFAERARPSASKTNETAQTPLWLDRYLQTRSANYLWFGFVYPWDALPDDLETRLVDDLLALFPLNEALMEQAELQAYGPAGLLREASLPYHTGSLPAIEQIIERVHQGGFALSERLIRAYHVALQTKPLVILPGISGTGKTRLTRLYADAVHGIAPGASNPFYLLVAVQPDWHSARDLLGYYNALTNTYQATPFLRLLLRASADPQQPYYICLDEMNLARPEYYLAPLLSALETSDHSIDLGVPGDEVRTASGETIANPFRLPLNIHIIGTVNVDESTHSLSDKLLDRANLIELTDVDLDAFRAGYQGPINEEVWQTIVAIHALMSRAGQPFGYRTISEILRYIEQSYGILPLLGALDLQIKQKILPKLKGEDSPRLRRSLSELLGLLIGGPAPTRASQVSEEQLRQARFPDSAEKVWHMLERLDLEGFTDFYG